VLSPRVKQTGHEADHSPPSGAEVKNAWRYASISPCVLIAKTNNSSLPLPPDPKHTAVRMYPSAARIGDQYRRSSCRRAKALAHQSPHVAFWSMTRRADGVPCHSLVTSGWRYLSRVQCTAWSNETPAVITSIYAMNQGTPYPMRATLLKISHAGNITEDISCRQRYGRYLTQATLLKISHAGKFTEDISCGQHY
jgi:hypothetical protein